MVGRLLLLVPTTCSVCERDFNVIFWNFTEITYENAQGLWFQWSMREGYRHAKESYQNVQTSELSRFVVFQPNYLFISRLKTHNDS